MILEKTSSLSSRLDNGQPVKLSFYYHTKNTIKFINSLLTKVLSKNDMAYLQSTVETVIREMVVNAVKANSKRVFFKKENLDIENSYDYSMGISDFKEFIIAEQENIAVALKENGFKVDLYLKKENEGFRVMVRNNTGLLPFEQERINMRMEKARQYNDFADIYMDICDEEEGEGLGIPLTMLFLRNSGIGEDSFSIKTNGKITQSAFTIPFAVKPVDVTSAISKQIIDEVNSLPAMPENITLLQEMCTKPDVSVKDLAGRISIDPSLSASVLRLSNSAGFITSKRVDNILDAVMIIGLRNLNSILISTATRKIMDDKFSHFKSIWDHCNKTAYYSRIIANEVKLNRISDKIVLAALLHDLGKIVLLSLDEDILERINMVALKMQVRTSTVIEEVSIGISHSTIGRLIAEKWNLPPYIIEAIAHHHSPLNASDEYKDIVYITYLANKLCLIEEKKFDYYYLEDDVLDRYNITCKKDFDVFMKKVTRSYNEAGV